MTGWFELVLDICMLVFVCVRFGFVVLRWLVAGGAVLIMFVVDCYS